MSYLHVSKQPTGTGECHNNTTGNGYESVVWSNLCYSRIWQPWMQRILFERCVLHVLLRYDAPWANFKPCLGTEITLEVPALCRHSPVIIIVCWWYPHIVFAFVRWFCVPNLKEKPWNEPSESPKPSFTRFVCRGYGHILAFFPQLGGEITMVLVIPTPNHRRNA